jgi:predicted GNAT family N-acyltransferase
MIQFQMTDCPEEREQAYRLRYEVYVEEFGYPFRAEQQSIHDELDLSAIHFQLKRGDTLIGTARANAISTLTDARIWERYGIVKSNLREPASVGIASRFILAKGSRGGPHFCKFLQEIYVWGLHHGFRSTYLDASPQLAPMYARLGWTQCAATYLDNALGVRIPMYLDMLDEAHLHTIRSPLYKSLQRAFSGTPPHPQPRERTPLPAQIDPFRSTRLHGSGSGSHSLQTASFPAL